MVLQTIAGHEGVYEIAVQGIGDFLEALEADGLFDFGCLEGVE